MGMCLVRVKVHIKLTTRKKQRLPKSFSHFNIKMEMAARLYGNRKLFYFLHKATLEISIEANARAYITAIRSILSFDCEI